MKQTLLETNFTLTNVATVIGMFAVVGGVLAWWLARFLDDKKDKITHELQIKDLFRRVKKLEDHQEKESERRRNN